MPPRPKNADLRRRGEYLTEHEIEALMAAAWQNRRGHRDATTILVAFRHGLRAAEATDLRWRRRRSCCAFPKNPRSMPADRCQPIDVTFPDFERLMPAGRAPHGVVVIPRAQLSRARRATAIYSGAVEPKDIAPIVRLCIGFRDVAARLTLTRELHCA